MPGKKLDVAQHRNPAAARRVDQRLFERKSRTDAKQVDALEQADVEGAGVQRRADKVVRARRRGAGVGNPHLPALAPDPLRDGQAGVAQAEDQHLQPREPHRGGAGEKGEGGFAHVHG